jgi:hypothetical protein
MAIKGKRALVWSALAASFYTQGGRVAWSALAASKLHVTASPAHPRTLKRQDLVESSDDRRVLHNVNSPLPAHLFFLRPPFASSCSLAELQMGFMSYPICRLGELRSSFELASSATSTADQPSNTNSPSS